MRRIVFYLLSILLDNRLIGCLFRLYSKQKALFYKDKGRLRSIYYKKVFAECGENLKIFGAPIIYQPHKIHVGHNFTINNSAQISPRGEIYIGNNVTMSRGSQITSGMYDLTEWEYTRLTGVKKHISKDVYIGDGTWLCVNSIVLPGVKITGKGVVVAAGAVVTSDIKEDFVVVGGVPAKIIKYINSNKNTKRC